MLRHVAVVRTDFSEEHIASIIKVTRIGQLGTSAVISNRSMLQRNATLCSLHSISSQHASVAKMFIAGQYLSL
jgi:hypothetical protein